MFDAREARLDAERFRVGWDLKMLVTEQLWQINQLRNHAQSHYVDTIRQRVRWQSSFA